MEPIRAVRGVPPVPAIDPLLQPGVVVRRDAELHQAAGDRRWTFRTHGGDQPGYATATRNDDTTQDAAGAPRIDADVTPGDDVAQRIDAQESEPVIGAPGNGAEPGAGPEVEVETDVAVTVDDGGADFHAFYIDVRPRVGRALALTLRDDDLATDCVDEALVRAYQRWDRVSRLDNPAGWVYRVGLNHARSRVRRLLRRPPPLTITTVDPPVADPAIERALAALPVDQRAVVVCRHLFGWSERETADALGIRPGTVKSRLSRALERLERELHHLR